MNSISIKDQTKKLACFLFVLCLLLNPASGQQNKFPDWMNEVEFKSNAGSSQEFQFNGPSAPVDPETGQGSSLKGSGKSGLFKKPALPDFTKLREKAIKATMERKASDSLMFEDTINFSQTNQKKLENSRNELCDLLKTITDPVEKKRLTDEKEQMDSKLSAMTQLYQLLGNNPANLQKSLSNLSEDDYRKAIELQRMIFGKPADFKAPASPKSSSADKDTESFPTSKKSERFYKPGKFKSFYQESKQKKFLDDEETP